MCSVETGVVGKKRRRGFENRYEKRARVGEDMLSNAEGCCLNIRIRQRYVDRSIATNDSVADKASGGTTKQQQKCLLSNQKMMSPPALHFTSLPPTS